MAAEPHATEQPTTTKSSCVLFCLSLLPFGQGRPHPSLLSARLPLSNAGDSHDEFVVPGSVRYRAGEHGAGIATHCRSVEGGRHQAVRCRSPPQERQLHPDLGLNIHICRIFDWSREIRPPLIVTQALSSMPAGSYDCRAYSLHICRQFAFHPQSRFARRTSPSRWSAGRRVTCRLRRRSDLQYMTKHTINGSFHLFSSHLFSSVR